MTWKKWIIGVALCLCMLVCTVYAVDDATTAWLDTSGNGLSVGGVKVTAENADNITGDGITGAVSFAVVDGTPTLTLNNASITGGTPVSQGKYYIYPIHINGSSGLKLVLQGTNRIEAAATTEVPDTFGIYMGEDKGQLTLSGDADSVLTINSTNAGLYIYDGITIEGGAYHITSGEGYGSAEFGKAFYSCGPITIQNANVTAKGTNACGIYSDDYEYGFRIINSTVTAIGGSTSDEYPHDGIYSTIQLDISNSKVTAQGGSHGIYVHDRGGIQIRGRDTVVEVNSTSSQPAIYSEYYGEYGYPEYYGLGCIRLYDDLHIAAPENGFLGFYNGNSTVCGSDGNYASTATIAYGHNWQLVEEVPTTKTTTGMKEHYRCSCGQLAIMEGDSYTIVEEADLIIPVKESSIVVIAPATPAQPEPNPATGTQDGISAAVALVVISALGIMALSYKKIS